jgi:hypothetical protein
VPAAQPPQAQRAEQPSLNPPANASPAQGPDINLRDDSKNAPVNTQDPARQSSSTGGVNDEVSPKELPSGSSTDAANTYAAKSRETQPSKRSRTGNAGSKLNGLTRKEAEQLVGPIAKNANPIATAVVSTDDLLAVYFTPGGEGWVLGRSGQIYNLPPTDAVWEFVGVANFGFAKNVDALSIYGTLSPRPALTSARFLNELSGFRPGVVAEWRGVIPPAAAKSPATFAFLGPLFDLSGANRGPFRFESTGQSLADSAATSDMSLNAIHRTSSLWWGVGEHGLVLRSQNQGRTWLHETQGPGISPTNRRLPAPWYWVSMALLVSVCLIVMWAPEPVQVIQSVADWAVTDAPLKPGDLDALDFTPVALGLSRFIRNPKTQPPITVAIEGRWGEGKSSLMSLLCGDLRKSRLRPVWFNAWHHQSEEQLLGSLLENIRKQGLPPWWHFDNIVFRARLLFFRFGRMWPLMTLLALACVWTSAYEVAHHGSEHVSWKQSVANTLGTARGAWDNIWAKSEAAKDLEEGKTPTKQVAEAAKDDPGKGVALDGSGWAMLFSVLGFLGAISKRIKAFGVDSAKLATQFKDGAKVTDIKPEPGIRRQFAREFGDVCRAWRWGSRRVIIFIDDLDRCRPDNVVTVLESVNFLTTAGDCFVVLGIAPETVTHCVGWSFKEIAESQAFCAGVANDEHSKAEARYRFGANYIRKLVNISVALPKTTDEQRARVLEAKLERAAEESVAADTDRERLWRRIKKTARVSWKVAPATILLALAAASGWIGYQAGGKAEPMGTMTSALGDRDTSERPGTIAPQGVTSSQTGTVLDYKRATEEQAQLHTDPVQPGGKLVSVAIYLLLIGLVMSVAGYLLTERSNEDAQNSPEFEKALAIWTPCIVTGCDTPRELKRLVNDLRYRAMTERDTGPTVTRGERVTQYLRRIVTGRKAQVESARGVDEAALVPPAVLAIFEPLMSPEDLKRFHDGQDQTFDSSVRSLFNEMMKAKAQHVKTFSRWPLDTPKAQSVAAD